MPNKLSIEDRQQAALDSIEEGSYLIYRIYPTPEQRQLLLADPVKTMTESYC